MNLPPWTKRPFEIAYLLNPAFCALLIRDGALGYQQDTQDGLPFSLSFLLLPIALHESTRNKLPFRVTTKLHAWLGETPEVKVGFTERARGLVPYTKEALTFGLQKQSFKLTDNGHVIPTPGIKQPATWKNDLEIVACLRAARFIGRWFAQVGDPGTIYYMWGVQP